MSIFTASKSHPHLNACVNYLDGLDPMEAACWGYREAAEVLLAEVMERGGTLDTLIYPIVFNWRHYVELRLKIIYLVRHAMYEDAKLKSRDTIGSMNYGTRHGRTSSSSGPTAPSPLGGSWMNTSRTWLSTTRILTHFGTHST
jgi:hypothetical protein